MSPFVVDRNVRSIRSPRGGQIGANRDKSGGVAESGSAGAGAQQAVAGNRCEPVDTGQLSADQAVVEALS
jgi:hypothetical protein